MTNKSFIESDFPVKKVIEESWDLLGDSGRIFGEIESEKDT